MPKNSFAKYSKEELDMMTTGQLRRICIDERIMTNSAGVPTNTLPRDELMRLILRYRGKKEGPRIKQFFEDKATFLERRLVLPKYNDVHTSDAISIPPKITVFKDIGILESDSVCIEITSADKFANVLLVDNENRIYGICRVAYSDNSCLLIIESYGLNKNLLAGNHSNFCLLFFTESANENLIKIYDNSYNSEVKLSYIRVRILELYVINAPQTNEPLIMDWGSSYTVASGLASEQKVFFKKKECSPCVNCGKCNICPSVVVVDNCSDKNNIKLLFGFDALNELKKVGYSTSKSIFYDIKRFVTNYTESLTINDGKGNTCEIERGQSIKRFLIFVIKASEAMYKNKFKNIYLTAPVKQKKPFFQMCKALLPEFNVEMQIDEGFAILYNQIKDNIVNKKFEEDINYRALIFDCGGGTSDMILCRYTLRRTELNLEICVSSSFLNGDTNFGGNNLTYRILQFLKIRIADFYLKNDPHSLKELFGDEIMDIYQYVDNHGIVKFYENFEKIYKESEDVIPTEYDENSTHLDLFAKAKGNFYFLWNLAELIKHEFYNQLGISQISVKELLTTRFKPIAGLDLFVLKNGKTVSYTNYPDVVITREEINFILTGDIYNLIKRFFKPIHREFIDNDDVISMSDDINYIKLTGQSCKIPIFKDALREYVLGIKARVAQQSSYALKHMCIEGAIKYYRDIRRGNIVSRIEYNSPHIPYSVTSINHYDEPDILIPYLQKISEVGSHISRHINTKEIEIMIKNKSLNKIDRHTVYVDVDTFEPTDYYTIKKKYGEKLSQQVDLDNILDDNEMKLFIFSNDNNWGFYVLPIARRDNLQILMGECRYYPFETNEWELNLFDGCR